MNEEEDLITVTRWIDNDPAIVLRARVADRPVLPAAWSNGDEIHVSVHGFELVMPAEVWELVTAEIRHAVATRELSVGGGSSIGGKDARHVRSNVLLPGEAQELAEALRRHPSAGVTVAGSTELVDELADRRREQAGL